MKPFHYLLTGLLFVVFNSPSFSQTKTPADGFSVESSKAFFLGKTRPIRDIVVAPATDLEKRSLSKRNLPKNVPNFNNHKPIPKVNPDALPKGADPVLQNPATRSTGTVIEPILNIEGIGIDDAAGVLVADPCGEIGQDYYVQMVNATFFQVFDKDGNALSAPLTANTIWAPLGAQSAGDPIILYDQEAERWLLTEFTSPFAINSVLIAVSETSDPLGSWFVYEFITPDFPDYPKYGIWPNAYILTTNENGLDNSTLTFYALDRQALLAGSDDVSLQRFLVPNPLASIPSIFTVTPLDWDGAQAPPADALPTVIRMNDDAWGDAATDRLEYWEMEIDFADEDNSVVFGPSFVEIADFDSNPCESDQFACIEQGGDGVLITAFSQIIMHRVQYRNFGSFEAVVLNFVVDATGNNDAGIRWCELRRQPGQDWELYQEGTYVSEDGLNTFLGAIAMDGAGNIGMGFNVTGDGVAPSMRFTGRRASDPLGEMTVEEFEVGTGDVFTFFRVGDYSAMSVDPTDERTFWYTGTYNKGDDDNDWETRIVTFQLKRDTVDIGPFGLLEPKDTTEFSATEPVLLQVRNFGLDTQQVFTVGYTFEDGPAVIDTVNYLLLPDSFYVHDFGTTEDLSANGIYEFKLFTSLDGDENIFNDTLRVSRQNYPRYDAGITKIDGPLGISCDSFIPISYTLRNFGTDTLTSVQIDLFVNGSNINTNNWTGSLPFQGTETIDFTLTGLTDGDNEVLIVTSLPNGEMDEVISNDSLSRTFQVFTTGTSTVTLSITTDFYPFETTWELLDSNGEVIQSGGDYSDQFTTYTEEPWCLLRDSCYTFVINDDFGDGINFPGGYEITNDQGQVIASIINNNFGNQEINEFCASCFLTAVVNSVPTSEPGVEDGEIVISPTSGAGPYEYSIDGGENFQSENIFTGLPAGFYDIVVNDQNGCGYNSQVEIIACQIQAIADVQDASGEDVADGTIVVQASNTNGFVQYSIDGGTTFQSSPVFDDLLPGDYSILIVDNIGCDFVLDATVDFGTGLQNHTFGYTVQISPNPTEGIFRAEVKGIQDGVKLGLQILNGQGQLIQTANLIKYGDTHKGSFSLLTAPAGVYYLRFRHEKIDKVYKLIKQ
jgi:hypothetical protein